MEEEHIKLIELIDKSLDLQISCIEKNTNELKKTLYSLESILNSVKDNKQ